MAITISAEPLLELQPSHWLEMANQNNHGECTKRANHNRPGHDEGQEGKRGVRLGIAGAHRAFVFKSNQAGFYLFAELWSQRGNEGELDKITNRAYNAGLDSFYYTRNYRIGLHSHFIQWNRLPRAAMCI